MRRDKAARSPKPSSACSRVGGIEPVSALGVLVSISSVGAGAVGVTAICCSTPNCQRRTGTYVGKYQGLRNSGEAVIIDGLCASACTIVLGAIPRDRICVTSHANLGFHAAWDFGANGRAITNPEATQMLYSMYPSVIRRWIELAAA